MLRIEKKDAAINLKNIYRAQEAKSVPPQIR